MTYDIDELDRRRLKKLVCNEFFEKLRTIYNRDLIIAFKNSNIHTVPAQVRVAVLNVC